MFMLKNGWYHKEALKKCCGAQKRTSFMCLMSKIEKKWIILVTRHRRDEYNLVALKLECWLG